MILAAEFQWILSGVLGGMSQPGIRPGGYRVEEDELIRDLIGLRERGVGAVVNLTEASLSEEVVKGTGLAYLHLPVPDLEAPTIAQLDEFIKFVEEHEGAGKGVAAHCRAGLGRTGTMLAAFLVFRGAAARAAISKVRAFRPGSIETPAQEAAIFVYAAHCRTDSGDGALG